MRRDNTDWGTDMKERTIIQLLSAGTPAVLVALCDDGSVWQRSEDNTEQSWQPLLSIPKREPAQSVAVEPRPANMGQRWETEHDDHLRRLWSEHGKLCSEIAAIMARLAHLKSFAGRESAREADRARRAARNAVKPPAYG